MKHLLSLLLMLGSYFAHAQPNTWPLADSLVTDPVSFQHLKAAITQIESRFLNRDSISYSIDTNAQWVFTCSYKTGWQEVIGGKRDGSTGMQVYRTDFNDISVPRTSRSFSVNELRKLFYFTENSFARDINGEITSGPVVITLDKKYLIVRTGSYYPNGNQTSWSYTHTYYFKRRQE